MTAKLLLILTTGLFNSAHAMLAPDVVVKCKVLSFDATNVELNCDPANKDQHLKTPRAWIESGDKVRTSQIVTLHMSREDMQKWTKANGLPVDGKKGEAK